MRGDRPPPLFLLTRATAFTPHARGSTRVFTIRALSPGVYPACAGIDLQRPSLCFVKPGLPRMRGDRPTCFLAASVSYPFTPHARGSTSAPVSGSGIVSVYPACAGIDRSRFISNNLPASLPRMRGDRPSSGSLSSILTMFTPHARGSTAIRPGSVLLYMVYPACAGIDLMMLSSYLYCNSLPRMRGDRPVKGDN